MLSKSDPDRVPTYKRVLELAQKSFDLQGPAGQPGRHPLRGDDAAGLLQPGAGHRRRPRAGDRAGQRPGLGQGAHVLLVSLGGARRPRHLLPDARPARHRGGAAPAGADRPDRHRGLGRRGRGLPAHPRRRRRLPHRHRGLVARRLLRTPGRRVREAVRARRRLGRQPQLGRGAAPPARARGRAAGPPLLGARAVGVGVPRRTSTPSSTSPTTSTWTASSRRSPCRS